MNAPYSPWAPNQWYGPQPQPNTIFIPVQVPPGVNPEPRSKKEKKNTIKGLAAQITALDELKKKLEGDKKDKGEKKEEMKPGDLLKAWGMITFFGPPVGMMYYHLFKYFFM